MPSLNIQIINAQTCLRLRKTSLKKLIERACRKLGLTKGVISFVFTDDRRIRLLNKEYFRKDRPTDVICFDLRDDADPSGCLAEVIISCEQARRNWRIFSTDLRRELLLYVVHGLLHLFGFKDTTLSQKKIIRKKEEELISFLYKTEKRSIASMVV
ncbi:rRNA maturation RNase YbeY [Candidatus Omnitrophota bacterium]